RWRGDDDEGGGEAVYPGGWVLEGESEPIGRPAGHREQVWVVGLRQVDDAPVVVEVDRLELRVAVDAEAPDDQPLDVAGEEVGQPERAGLVGRHCRAPP